MIKNITKVFSANALNMSISIISAFLLPYFLSIDTYAEIKTFTFYVSYIGILHLGFTDGIYIKYGGDTMKNINFRQVAYEKKVLVIFQLLVSLALLVPATMLKNQVFIIFSLSILPINLMNFYRQFFQAIGEFSYFSFATFFSAITTFLINIVLVFIVKLDSVWLFSLAILAGYIVVDMYFFFRIKELRGGNSQREDKVFLSTIKVGIFILFGNLSVNLVTAIDRWFIKFFYNKEAFAFYSFAASMLALINVVISSISVTFYNYLVNNRDEEYLRLIKNMLVIIGTFCMLAYFPLDIIVLQFFPQYKDSLAVISISFMTLPFIIVINSIYVNLYKADKNQKRYFRKVIEVLIISIILNAVLMKIYPHFTSVTIASLIVYIGWYIYSEKEFPYLSSTFKEYLYLILCLAIFGILTFFGNKIINLFLCLVIFILLTYFLKRNEIVKITKKFSRLKEEKHE